MFLALSILFGFLNSVAALGKRICLFVRMSVDMKSKLLLNNPTNIIMLELLDIAALLMDTIILV